MNGSKAKKKRERKEHNRSFFFLLLLVLALSFSCPVAHAGFDQYILNWFVSEEYDVTGYVKNEIGAALPNVHITNNKTSESDYTDDSGFYKLRLKNSTYLITASKLHYASNSTIITVDGASINNINFTLKEIGEPPIITDWYNNITNDSQPIIYINTSTCIYFNVTASQTIDTFYWYKAENFLSDEHYDNITVCWSDTNETGIFKVYGENINGTTNTVVWYVGENMSFIYEQTQLLLEAEEMMGLSLLLVVLIVVGFVLFLLGVLVPHSVLTLLGSITFFITMALPVSVLQDYAYFGIALTMTLFMFGLIALIITFYQFFTVYTAHRDYEEWGQYFDEE